MKAYSKIGLSTIEVSRVIPQEIIPEKKDTKRYDYEFLVKQKGALAKDLANLVARHATEIEVAQANVDEVNLLLLESGKLGIVEKAEPQKANVDEATKPQKP